MDDSLSAGWVNEVASRALVLWAPRVFEEVSMRLRARVIMVPVGVEVVEVWQEEREIW